MKEKIIVALDTSEEVKVRELVETLGSTVNTYKVGLEQYLTSKGSVIDYLHSKNKRVFLDLKFHDIPNTLAAAAKAAVKEGVWMFNMHVTNMEGMKRVVETVEEESARLGIPKPLVIGVTLLTSMAQEDLLETGITVSPQELVVRRSELAKKAGLDGVVASAREVEAIKKSCGSAFITVCPGIRPIWAAKGDQKRVTTPAKALKAGAHYLVVGRPITMAENPYEAAEKIIEEMKEVEN